MRTISIVVAAFATLLLSSQAYAHAMLDHTNPPVGSSSPKSPRELDLWFTQDIEPAFSHVEIRNAAGGVVYSGKGNGGARDHTKISVPLAPLPPGTYKVIWRVLSVDTHRTQGDFTFRVGE